MHNLCLNLSGNLCKRNFKNVYIYIIEICFKNRLTPYPRFIKILTNKYHSMFTNKLYENTQELEQTRVIVHEENSNSVSLFTSKNDFHMRILF